MRAKYVLNEVLVGLWRNVTMTIAMIITMSVSLTMLGASMLMYLQVDRMKTFYYSEIEVAMFMRADVTEAQRTSLKTALESDPQVAKAIFESKDQAYERFKELWRDSPNLSNTVKPGQLPESFRVKLTNPVAFKEFTAKYQGKEGIDEIVDQRQLLDKVFGIFDAIQVTALVTASFMAFAALLLVGNTIQVAAYSKRREVAVMKLVGASNWFIQAPFVLEAVVAGLIGSLIGFGALLLSKLLLIDGPLKALAELLTPIPMSNVWLMLPLMAGVGSLVSALTAWVTLRFYLRV